MKYLIGIVLLFVSTQAMAWHTSRGKIKNINLYSATDAVLVTLKNASTGEDVDGVATNCSSTKTFAISNTISEERRARMLSVLLMAKASDRAVSLSYKTSEGCVAYGPDPKAYRGIVRIIL